MQECKERETILHLQVIIRSLIDGITPGDFWTSVEKMLGQDWLTDVNIMLFEERQSRFAFTPL